MKKLASFGWILLLLPVLSYAGTKSILNKISSTESRDTESRNVAGFHSISSGGSFEVYITMSNKESLRLEGDKEQLENVQTKVENGVLKIQYKKSTYFSLRQTKKVKVFITAKELTTIGLSGSGNISVTGALKTGTVSASVSGSGHISFAAKVNHMNATVSGSGGIKANGSATSATITVSGSGTFEGQDLHSQTTEVKISGSGWVKIYAEKSINAKISGSGNLYYSGNASVNLKKSGSGSVSKIQ